MVEMPESKLVRMPNASAARICWIQDTQSLDEPTTLSKSSAPYKTQDPDTEHPLTPHVHHENVYWVLDSIDFMEYSKLPIIQRAAHAANTIVGRM